MYRDSSSRRIKTQIFLLLLKFYNSGKEFKTIYQGFTIIEFEQFERLSFTRRTAFIFIFTWLKPYKNGRELIDRSHLRCD